MNHKDMTPEEFRSFLIDELNGVLSMPGAWLVESKVQRAVLAMAVASVSSASIPEIARWQSHYVAP